MTNEEKAKELNAKFKFNASYQYKTVVDVLIEMAEWKEQQFNEEKKELFGLVSMLKIDETNQTIIEDLKAMLE